MEVRKNAKRIIFFRRVVGRRELTAFTRQMAMLIKAAMPIARAKKWPVEKIVVG
jgi:hypothetical protein